ncbi:MAG TPA: radical SAM protein, partial [Candidatus Bathyarchaeota archaeon]|nr:radical SAM protein [Candidatus Bathyarchaeota archaeon]
MSRILEANAIKKDWRKVQLRVALCYPNVYRVGMTGLPIKLLYHLMNVREDTACERFFVPTRDEPLLSLESRQPLKRFDVVAFSLQYEWDYANVVKILLDSGIPLKSAERKETHPLVIAGGPCVIENPLPLSPYIDLFVIGEAEEVLDRVLDSIIEQGRNCLEDLAGRRGVYVPALDERAERAWVRRLDEAPHPTAQVVPLVD